MERAERILFQLFRFRSAQSRFCNCIPVIIIDLFFYILYSNFNSKGSTPYGVEDSEWSGRHSSIVVHTTKGVFMNVGNITVLVIFVVLGALTLAYVIWSRNNSDDSEDQTKK